MLCAIATFQISVLFMNKKKLIKVLSILAAFTQGTSASADTQPLQGDPAQGYDFLVNGNYIGCGIPISVAKRLDLAWDLAPPPLRNALPIIDSRIFSDPGIPGRRGTNANLSHSFNAFVTKRGTEVASFNCLSCHAERIHGQVIVGLGNTTRDYTVD